jgi:hypothetical protein
MDITSTNSTSQVISAKRANKKRVYRIVRPSPCYLRLASLPKIDPHLISIAALASRLIARAEDAFTDIMNASSNDGREVTLTQWFRCAREDPEHFKGERVEIDGAFNILLGDIFDILLDHICDWHLKCTRIHLSTLEIIDGKFKVEPPIEIREAVQAFAIVDKRRDALTAMLCHSMRNPTYSAAH